MPLQVSPRGTPTLHLGCPAGSVTYGHTGATSAGCQVKRQERGRGEAAEKPGDIWKGPQGAMLGLSALLGFPGSEV